MKRVAIGVLLLTAVAVAGAQDGGKSKKPIVTPPPPPEELTDNQEDIGEPAVTILQREWATITEYSVAGRVYAVRVEPTWGPPYYLYDSDGDGSLETQRTATEGVPEINRWKILTW